MSAALITIANTTIETTAADAFGGFLALIVGIVSFLAISGLALSMTIGASRSPGTMAITGIAGLLSVVISVGLYAVLTSAHGAKPSTWDWVGTVIAFTVGILSSLSLGGVAVVMTMGAFMPSKQPITSWPAEHEQSFAGFERRNAQTQSQAWVFAVVAAVLVFVSAIGIYKGVKPEIQDLSKDMNMSNLTKKSKTDAPAPDAKAPEAPKPAAPEAPKAPEAAPAAE